MTEQFMPKVDGKSWHCECGANVFHKPEGESDVFECNACGAWYTDKESVKARIEKGYRQYDELIALAQSKNDEATFNGVPRDYKIAVIYDGPKPDFQGNVNLEAMWNAGYRRVVKMEGR